MTFLPSIADLVSSIFGKLLSAFMAAWKQENLEKKASEADAAIKRLASSEASHNMEAKLEELTKGPPRVGTMKDIIRQYNQGLLLLLALTACLCSSGCIYLGRNVYFESRRPLFPIPERAKLQETPDGASDAEALKIMEANLRAVLERERGMEKMLLYWNEKAVEVNSQNGYVVP